MQQFTSGKDSDWPIGNEPAVAPLKAVAPCAELKLAALANPAAIRVAASRGPPFRSVRNM
jgi:hypothetical protein